MSTPPPNEPLDQQLLEELLLKLLEAPKDQREKWLDSDQVDPRIAHRARRLLSDREALRRHLEQIGGSADRTPVYPDPTTEDPTLTSGGLSTAQPIHSDGPPVMSLATLRPESIGPYEVLRELGRGGMGVVYLAKQTEPVERQLAIKLVRRNLESPMAAARFQAERKAMARLSHPNIAQIYEAGTTDDGFPYFAMEYVRGGMPITDYCDSKQLSIEERLELFIAVCRGVHHAHQRGIIHRDLKPSNVLVAEQQGEPLAKIIDFGLAKALDNPLIDDTQLTQNHVVGTPEYMSPEAFQLGDPGAQIDTRSDVFSLGVILYELLCGCRPFETEGMSFLQKVQHLFEGDPPRPSRRLSTTADVSRTKIADRRQTEPTALRRRLSEDLDFVILKAIAYELDERYGSVADLASDLKRYLRQEPVSAHPPSHTYRLRKLVRRHRSGVLAAMLVVLAMVLGTIGTTVGMVRAHREAQTARQALAEAEELAAFLKQLFRSSQPGNPARDMTARQLLDAGAGQIGRGFKDQPQAKARILTTIGDIYIHLALFNEAEAMLAESLELWKGSGSTMHAGYGEALLSSGKLAKHQDRYSESLLYLEEALEIFEHLGLNELYAETVLEQGLSVSAAGDRARGEELLEQSVQLYEQTFGPEDLKTGTILSSLAVLKLRQDQYAEAETLARRAVEIAERHLGPEHPQLSSALRALADVHSRRGRLDEAHQALEQVLDIEIQAYGEIHPRVAQVTSELASSSALLGKGARAEELFRRSVEIAEAVFGPSSLDLSVTLNNFGAFYWNLDRYADAEPLYQRSLEIKRQKLGPEHPRVAHSLNNLGLIYWKRQQFNRAESMLLQSLKIWEKDRGATHRLVAWPLWGLAGVYRDQGRYEDAEPLYRRALSIREQHLPAHDPNLHVTRSDFAELLRLTGRPEKASALEAENVGDPRS